MSKEIHIECKASAQSMSREAVAVNPDTVEFKKRMLEWPNPVEYVNNMYGCHPADDNTEYFKVVFGK